MKSTLKTPVWASVAVASALGCIPLTSQATLMLAGQIRQIGGTTVQFCASDNNNPSCSYGGSIQDVDSTGMVLQLGGTTPGPVNINNVMVSGSLHRQTIGNPDILDSSSLSVINNSGFTVEVDVAVGGNGYSDIASLSTSASGTFLLSSGSTVTNEWWIRPGNSQPGVDPFDPSRPGTRIHLFTDTAGTDAYSYSNSSGPNPFPVVGAYGLEEIFRFTLAPGGSLTSRGQVAIGFQEEVPEPASLALVGLGGLALAFVRRHKARKT